MATSTAPQEKLDELLEKKGSVTFFAVKDGILTETVISKSVEYISFPIAEVVRDVTENFDMYLYQTLNNVSNLKDEYEYSEDDFVEVGQTHCYAIAQVDISIDELARRLFELSKQYPFSQYIAGKEIISHGNYKYKKYGMVFDPDAIESVIADGGYKNDPEALEVLKEEVSGLKDSLSDIADIAQRISSESNIVKVRPGEMSKDALWKVLGKYLPGMNKVSDIIDTGLSWGVSYDAANGVLFPTVNGQRYTRPQLEGYSKRIHDASMRITPEDLSIMLSGLVPTPNDYIFRFLATPEGKPFADELRASLPDPRPLFDKRVEDYLAERVSSGAWELVTAGDKPHGLHFKNGTFIPIQEILSNQSVLHLCNAGGTNALDGSYVYYSFFEFVKDGNQYIAGEGRDSWTETEFDRDCDKTYPPTMTTLKIQDDKIVKTVLYEASGKGKEALSPDTVNSRMCASSKIKDSVLSAALFAYCNKMKELNIA